MSLLNNLYNRAKNTVTGVYNYFVGNDNNAQKSSSTKKTYNTQKTQTKPKANYPNSVTNPNNKTVGQVGDVLVKNTQPKSKKTTVKKHTAQKLVNTTASSKELSNTINTLCAKAGINRKDLEKGLITILGFNDISKLSEKQKVVILGFIANSLSRVIDINKKINDKIDPLETVLADIIITYEVVVNQKSFSDIKQYNKAVDNIGISFFENIENITEEEFITRMDQFEDKMHAMFESKKAEIDEKFKNDKKGKKAAIKELREQQEAMRNGLLTRYIFGKTSNENSVNALQMSSSKHLGKMNKVLYDIQKTDEGRREVAHLQTFENDTKILKAQQRRGEEFNKESYEEYVSTHTSWKSADELNEYQDAFYNAVQNKDNPEYSFLTDDVIMSTNKGVGFGAEINHVMTSEEREAFIQKWTEDVKNYYGEDSNEFKEIKEYVENKINEYLEAHPEEKSKISGSTKSNRPKNDNNTIKQDGNTETPANSNFFATVSQGKEANKTTTKQQTYNTKVTNPLKDTKDSLPTGIKSEQSVKIALLTGNMNEEEAIKSLGSREALYRLYLKDSNLLSRNKDKVICYIKNQKDEDKLLELATGISQSGIELIIKNMTGSPEEFTQRLISQNKVSHDTKVMIEKEMEHYEAA